MDENINNENIGEERWRRGSRGAVRRHGGMAGEENGEANQWKHKVKRWGLVRVSGGRAIWRCAALRAAPRVCGAPPRRANQARCADGLQRCAIRHGSRAGRIAAGWQQQP